ncbi:hypothetical protein BDF19DRAFT_345753, partial [Syncephalis fuscata]
ASETDTISQQLRSSRLWTDEHTNMLVRACVKHNVGNWKAILDDPSFKFDNYTGIDLRDK